MDSKNQMNEILDAYRNKGFDIAATIFGTAGLVQLISAACIDNTSLSISGASFVGLAIVGEGLQYMKAYYEARLDYLRNNKFTRLEE